MMQFASPQPCLTLPHTFTSIQSPLSHSCLSRARRRHANEVNEGMHGKRAREAGRQGGREEGRKKRGKESEERDHPATTQKAAAARASL
eukprot:1736128-Rhodomonas_salina.1